MPERCKRIADCGKHQAMNCAPQLCTETQTLHRGQDLSLLPIQNRKDQAAVAAEPEAVLEVVLAAVLAAVVAEREAREEREELVAAEGLAERVGLAELAGVGEPEDPEEREERGEELGPQAARRVRP